MKKLATAIFHTFLMACIPVFPQDISVTFSATGAANQVETVTASNLTTGESITFPGNGTLILGSTTSIPDITEPGHTGRIYPNPFAGTTTLAVNIATAQQVSVRVMTLGGQLITEHQSFVEPGECSFAISVPTSGVYLVTLFTREGVSSYKIVRQAEGEKGAIVIPAKAGTGRLGDRKTGIIWSLRYTQGDIILYKCKSGSYSTIITDSPVALKNYVVEFVVCTDADGWNYPVVLIGSQTWMAGNLAYLPAVSTSSKGSLSNAHYYVADYEGTSVGSAKATNNYSTYGVLYNYKAAKNACPDGWRLPSDDDWKVMERYLQMNDSDIDESGWRVSGLVGGKIKETGTAHWLSPNTGVNNSTGFTALPGGGRNQLGNFDYLGQYAIFVTSSETGLWSVWSRFPSWEGAGIGRYAGAKSNAGSVRCIKN